MLNKQHLFTLFVILALLTIGVLAQDMMSESLQSMTVHIETFPPGPDARVIENGTATLASSESGIFTHMSTGELEEGHVYTMWVVVINNPEACAGSPCTPADVLGNTEAVQADGTWGDGIVYDGDGHMDFTAFTPIGDLPNPWYGNGLTDPVGAEIHNLIIDHGELIPEMASTMLNTFRGGCTDESLPPTFPDTAKSDGEAGPNTCKIIQDAIWVQS